MSRVYNFGAGPGMLPVPVLQQAADELLDWQDSGMSVCEVSHRTKEYMALNEECLAGFRDVLAVPEHFKIILMATPARAQFSALPLNLCGNNSQADYINTGIWSDMAQKEAERYVQVNPNTGMDPEQWQLNDKAAYCFFCSNETINGLEFHQEPETGNVPLVSDMTSNLLSRPIDFSRYGIIFAGAQKNIAQAGLTIVIIREDLLQQAMPIVPKTFDYEFLVKQNSLYYTPPAFQIYCANLMLKWVKSQGGVEYFAEKSREKSSVFYNFVDNNEFYSNPIEPQFRSRMNIPFLLKDDNLNKRFISEAQKSGFVQVNGHRLVGGMRVSFYNAMPLEGVNALIDFMDDFAKHYG